jgi:hypothetical protein
VIVGDEVRGLPRVDFVQDLFVFWIVVTHPFAVFPECEVSDRCFLDCGGVGQDPLCGVLEKLKSKK